MPVFKRVFSRIKPTPLILFATLIFFIGLGDAIMSYVTPVYLENNTHSPFLMGLILSLSSVFGIAFDLFISEKQWNKNYKFFIKVTLFATLLFPLSLLLLPPNFYVYIFAMFIWGMYYEYKGYSMYNFIHRFLTPDEHTKGWSVIIAFSAFAYLLGPAISANIIDLGYKFSFFIALLPFGAAILLFKLLNSTYADRIKTHVKNVAESKKNFKTEIKILKTLWGRVWPIFMFSFLIVLVDSCFWTVGILLSEELKETSRLGSLLLVAYMLPPLFTGFFASKMAKDLGKKRTAFINGLLSAVFLVAVGATKSVPLIILSVFLMSVFISISGTLLSAVTEDYVARLSDFGNDIVTIEQISASFAYIVGPILMGFLAQIVGYQKTFVISGVSLGLMSFICMFIVPRKVKMPQVELQKTILAATN